MNPFYLCFCIVILSSCSGSDHENPIAPLEPAESAESAERFEIPVTVERLKNEATLIDLMSKKTYSLTENGTQSIAIETTSGLFNLRVLNTDDETCYFYTNNTQPGKAAELRCWNTLSDMSSQCVKVWLGDSLAEYKTVDDIWSVPGGLFTTGLSKCGNLEGTTVNNYHSPVHTTPLALYDTFRSDPFKVKATRIEGDTLIAVFEVIGGCGHHNFEFILDDHVYNGAVAYTFSHFQKDACTHRKSIEYRFDLTPYQEFYRMNNDIVPGVQTVTIAGIGKYTFRID